MKLKNVFQRKENKYTLSMDTYTLLRSYLEPYMTEDEYGLHTIVSIYFDMADYALIRQSILKPVYKEKFRLRSYGVPTADQTVFLELKKKVKGIVYKRRLALEYGQAMGYLQNPNCLSPKTFRDRQIKQEIDWLYAKKHLSPKVVIAYDRRALAARDEDLSDFRITFDFNIRYRTDHFNLSDGDFGERVAPEIDVLMEVKALGAYPLWFSELLSELSIYKCSFSKYAQVYQRYLFEEEFSHVI
ncbi:molecular chaperone [Enterococcus sp. JM4C]|uniref:polyphosphate polymerase domain-containing protein n=1 Tax=Candidatus Enterococcus huntleyi TaxID=1857217 RepID=UPI001379DB79|nr:polyphosphate polymerase domain-containing protein [Enterococcus sp. JM4C]KAF1296946.1 molecular chaperone [Enterococcus sp. JM4C]